MSANTTRFSSASSKSKSSRREAGTLARRTSRKKSINITFSPRIPRPNRYRVASPPLPGFVSSVRGAHSGFTTGHKRQPLQQMHILLVLQQSVVMRRNRLSRIMITQDFRRNLIGHQQLQPVNLLRGGRLLLQPGRLANIEENIQGLPHQVVLNIREVNPNDVFHGLLIW